MTRRSTLLAVLAHPDDEAMGTGGTLARYAAEGVEVHLVTATLGQRGWKGAKEAYPGPEALGERRAEELRAACAALGVPHPTLLGYMDGALDRVDPREAHERIADVVRSKRPDVVITFGPDGAYGHPDHIAVSQHTTAACLLAATEPGSDGTPRHRASKLYYLAPPKEELASYQEAFGDLKMQVGEVERRFAGWDDWAITTRLDVSAYVQQVWDAVHCHRSQLRDAEKLLRLPDASRRRIFGEQTYYRAFSLVNGGREIERDLFEGIRPESET